MLQELYKFAHVLHTFIQNNISCVALMHADTYTNIRTYTHEASSLGMEVTYIHHSTGIDYKDTNNNINMED